MRKIINFLLTILILWVGSTFFSQYIQIDSIQTIIIASVIMVGINIIFGILLFSSAILSTVLIGCLPFIIGIISIPFLDLIELNILSNYLHGFSIHGFWTYVFLVIAFWVCKVDISTNKN